MSASGGDGDDSGILMLGVIGTLGACVLVCACVVFAYLYTNGCSRKSDKDEDGGEENVQTFSVNFTDAAYVESRSICLK